jgi:hypothetical protein
MHFAVILVLGSLTLLPVQAFDRETYVVHERHISHEQPLSFSIDYPKTWKVLAPQTPPNGEFILRPESSLVCSFVSADGNSITVQRTIAKSPKEAATDFERSVEGRTVGFERKRFEPIQTKSGATGYILVWERDSIRELTPPQEQIQRRITSYDYFFIRPGAAGIQVTVVVQPGFAELAGEMNSSVLESLGF